MKLIIEYHYDCEHIGSYFVTDINKLNGIIEESFANSGYKADLLNVTIRTATSNEIANSQGVTKWLR